MTRTELRDRIANLLEGMEGMDFDDIADGVLTSIAEGAEERVNKSLGNPVAAARAVNAVLGEP